MMDQKPTGEERHEAHSPLAATDRRTRRPGRSLRAVVFTAAAVMLLSLATPLLSSGSGNAEAATTKAAGSRALAPSTYEARVQRWVNKKRAHHNLRRVRLSRCPDGTAERWSRHLAATGRFYHQSMRKVLRRCNARYAGETLGRGSMRPKRLVRMWMNSPGHRKILLSRQARRIGIGAEKVGRGRWVVTANFVRY